MAQKDFKIDIMPARTLSWWRTRREEIDMDPPYQRQGRLWSRTDKAYLIDSILNGYDVPKLYLADFTWGESPLNRRQLPYAIIDGKQRLEAIFDFYDSRVVLNKDFTYIDQPQLQLGGLGYKDLKERYPYVAELFDQYNLLIMAVSARTEAPIKELFVRLNRSKPLTGAEIRNAMSGPAPEVIRQIAKHEFFEENAGFSGSRGQDQNAAAKLLFFEYSNSLQETKKTSLDAFVKRAAQGLSEKVELAGRKVIDKLDEMQEIFLPKDPLLSSAGQLPVYFWFVRNCREADYSTVREFLVRFEDQRRENRQLVKTNPRDRSIDRQLVEYDQFNRNTNDLASHEGRVRILQVRFPKFRGSGSPDSRRKRST